MIDKTPGAFAGLAVKSQPPSLLLLQPGYTPNHKKSRR